MNRIKELFHELKHHVPFTALATLIAILLTLILIYGIKKDLSEDLFEVLHPIHVIASAIVTSGIFYKYKPKFLPAFLVGISGAIIFGSLSDVIFPYLGGNIFNLDTNFHLPIIEETFIILLAAGIGGIVGILTKITKIPHFLHVFVSVFASLFYLIAFSPTINLMFFVISFAIVFIAVIIPCCLSDIVFPFFFLGKRIKHCNCHI